MTYFFDSHIAFGANRSQIHFVADLAIKFAFLFNEADVLQRSLALDVIAEKVFGAPGFSKGSNIRAT